jgi:hypothetical protein
MSLASQRCEFPILRLEWFYRGGTNVPPLAGVHFGPDRTEFIRILQFCDQRSRSVGMARKIRRPTSSTQNAKNEPAIIPATVGQWLKMILS